MLYTNLNDVLGDPLFMNCNGCHFIICLYVINAKNNNYKYEVMPLMELRKSHAIAIVSHGYIIDDVI
jgi:hypothetical protein